MQFDKWVKEFRYEKRDGTSPIRFTIEESDVKLACRDKSRFCAAANALRRTAKFDVIHIGKHLAWVRRWDSRFVEKYMIPAPLGRAIRDFDKGLSFPTGKYILKTPPPGESLTNGVRTRNADSKTVNFKTKPRRKKGTKHKEKFTRRQLTM